MLWKCKWVKQRSKILEALGSTSIQSLFSPKPKQTTQITQTTTPSPRNIPPPKPLLTHDDVYSRLRSSPSDLNTLSFFFRCASEQNYFHDNRAFDHMVGVVEKLTREYKSVDRVIEELKLSGCVIKPRVLLLLLEIFWRGRLYDKAIEVYNGMNQFGFKPNIRALNMMMDVNFNVDVVHGALEIFEGIRDRNFFSFDIALCHLCRRGDLDMVKIVLMTMVREGYYPNEERFGQILGVFCRAGRVVEGFQVVGLMICCGFSVSVNVWSMLISGFFRSGEPQKAVDLYHKMMQIGCSPNLVTYTSLIKGLMDLRMDNEAISVLSTVMSRGLTPDIVFCNMMIQTFTRLGRYEDAREVFTSLEKWNLVADRYTFSSIVSSICLSGDFHLLSSITDGIATELDLVTGNSLLNYFSKVGDARNALKLVSHMSRLDLDLDCYTFSGYLTALCRGGPPEEAIRSYEGMMEQKIFLDAHVHTAVMDGLIERGRYKTAIDLFDRYVKEKYPVDVVLYTVVIKGLMRAKRTVEACSLLCEMKEAGVMPNRRTYRTIISGLCEEKDTEKVKNILWQCIDEGIELDLTTKRHVFDLLSRSHRDFSEFRSIFEKWNQNVDVSDSCDELSISVIKKVRVKVETNEDKWALKLLSSIAGVNQFLFEGRTRELFVLGFIGGQWIVGIIDEVRKASAQECSESGPVLSDTKTRVRDTLPAEPQRRNGRLQVMLYKLLWDTIVKEGFPAGRFYEYFSLDRHNVLSQDVRDNIANAGIPAQTLEEIVRYYENTFKMLPVANDQLLLRYEFQKDQSIIAEIRFNHDHEWVMSKYKEVIEFWRNEREAEYTPEEERWKCRFCQFAESCAGNPSLESTGPSSQPSQTPPLAG